MKISVIIPTYNGGHRLSRAIKSVFEQSYPVHEVLVFDDASIVDPYPYISDLIDNHDNLNVHRANENRGAGYARNYLLKNVSGEIVAFLDDDDYWYPNKLAQQVDLLQSNSADIVISYHHVSVGNEKLQTKTTPRIITKQMMITRNWIPMSMAIVSTKLIGWREMSDLRTRQDYAYWLKLFDLNEKLRCVSVEETLGVYSKRANSLSSNNFKNVVSNYSMYRQVLRKSPFNAALRTFINVVSKIKELLA